MEGSGSNNVGHKKRKKGQVLLWNGKATILIPILKH